MSMLPDDMDPVEALAADYALGALGADERREAELRLRREPAFAAAVARWEALLTPLAEETPPVAPPAAVWARVARAIDPPAAMPAPKPSFWASLSVWRALTAATSTVAAVAVALLVTRPVPVAPPAAVPGPLLTAALANPATSAVLINATFDAARGSVILTPAAADASAGKSPELWVIVGKAKPRSLGLIGLGAAHAHRIPADLLPQLHQGATLAISLEPAGGSPTGQPTGPVVAAGTLAAI